MAAYIIGIILIIIALITVGLILRKRVYDTVDRLEGWKMDITNRNTASQIARIKRLNLSGETQKQFESWKERWEYIVTRELPDIEEYLLDAEEAADRYRFPSTKKTLRKAEQALESIENDLENMLHELDDLLESEKTSRKEIEQIQPTIKSLRKKLSQNRYQYGKAEVRLEVELDDFDEHLVKYHELVDAGNYFEAKKIVDELKVELMKFQQQTDEFPIVYKACKDDLPAQLDDLFTGLKEMKEDGYRVDHLSFEKEIQDYQRRLLDCVKLLEKDGMSEAKVIVSEVEERIAEMYQLLEKEAIAKNYMETQIPSYRHMLEELGRNFHDTKAEVETLKQAYYFEDSDMEQYLALEKTISQLNNQLEEISADMEDEDTSHSQLREQLEDGFKHVEELQQNHDAFKKSVHNLRKDELAAKEKLADMKNQIHSLHRRLQKSNIPGVPTYIWNIMEESIHKNNLVLKSLEKQPLDITEVQQSLTEAKVAADSFAEQTNMMLEQAHLTEQVIQYANRYRSKFPILAAKLAESERLFRSCEYELALEQAAKSVEEVEPGALKRIEAHQEVVN